MRVDLIEGQPLPASESKTLDNPGVNRTGSRRASQPMVDRRFLDVELQRELDHAVRPNEALEFGFPGTLGDLLHRFLLLVAVPRERRSAGDRIRRSPELLTQHGEAIAARGLKHGGAIRRASWLKSIQFPQEVQSLWSEAVPSPLTGAALR
jgi:hypothetical protein